MEKELYDLKESREGFCRRGKGRSLHVDGPKPETVREPTVESLVRGYLEAERVSEAERVCKEIRRSSARCMFIAESIYLVLIFFWGWELVERYI